MDYLTTEQLAQVDRIARIVAREEIASLAGKALRRTQDAELTRNPVHNTTEAAIHHEAAQFWGEVLAEYSAKEEWPEPKASPETSGIAADYADSAE